MVKVKIHIRLVRSSRQGQGQGQGQDGQVQVYRAGDWIEGVVQLESHGDTPARAVRLKFNGYTFTDWSEGSSTTKMQHSDKHYLLKSLLTLWGYPKGSEGTLQLPAGSVLFPFRVRLPEVELPASGKYKHGYVRYQLKAYIDFPRALDIQVVREVDVTPLVPLVSSLPPDLVAEEDDSLLVGCCIFPCACFGSVQTHIRCLQPYLVPGTQLQWTASLRNQSRTRVSGVKLSLVHRMQFRAQSSEIRWVNTCREAQFALPIAPACAFSNQKHVDSTSPLDSDVAGASAESKLLRSDEKNPFVMSLPPDLPPVFDSRLISSNLDLVFQLILASPCANVPEIILPASIAADSLPGRDKDASDTYQRVYSAVMVQDASTGDYPVCFSFDDLNYNPDDQNVVGKTVAYPYFRDSSTEVTPLSIDKFDPTWRQLLEPVADT